jgi:hypothetical protein
MEAERQAAASWYESATEAERDAARAAVLAEMADDLRAFYEPKDPARCLSLRLAMHEQARSATPQ